MLHKLGHAHSVEVWQGEQLVGGLYGVQRGAKVGPVSAVERLFAAGMVLLDVQFLTVHLKLLGDYEIPRARYLELGANVARRPVPPSDRDIFATR